MKKLNYEQIAGLVEKSKNKDSDAFAQLYQMLYQKIYFYALSITKSENMAEDAVQESFMNAMTSLHTLKDDRTFVAWLNRITYNVCMSLLTEKSVQPAQEAFDDAAAKIPDRSDDFDPLARTVTGERNRNLLTEIQKLSIPLRTVIIMHYYNGMKLREISIVLDCPVGTVKSRLDAAKKQLRQSLSRGEKGEKEMLNYFVGAPIVSVLSEAGKNIAMNPTSASKALTSILSQNGMETAVHFVPQAGATAAWSMGKIAGAVGGAAGTVGAVAVGVVIATSGAPKITAVDFDGQLTKDAVSVSVQVEDASKVFVTDGNGTVTAGETADGEFVVGISENGSYVVTAENEDGDKDTYDLNINCIDKRGPVMSGYTAEGAKVVMTLADEPAGIDFTSAYGVLPDGTRRTPLSTDEKSGSITFEVNEGESGFMVYISDKVGNESKFIVESTQRVIKN